MIAPDGGARSAAAPKTILLVLKHLGLVRYYEPTLRVLHERGHRVYLAHSTSATSPANVYGERLVSACPGITLVQTAEREPGYWTTFARGVRLLFDYVRYFDSRFARATILRVRVEDKYIPRWGRVALRPLHLFGDRGVRTAVGILRRVEEAIPLSVPARELLEELQPDIVLVTPLVDWASPLVDYVRAGQALGIPTGLCVASWDNLTNKGHMRVIPDRVFVWNEPQKEEAVSLHDVPAENVVVTGAQLFDHLFRLEPAHDREEFCRTVGLDPERPFVVFVGSTTWIAPSELYFVERWIRYLRQADDPRVASLGVMIRPHPSAARRYLSMDVSQLENVCIWPPPATTVASEYFSPQGQHEFVEVIHHSVAAVGANTSAQIDAGIVGRPVCTLRVPEFVHSQEGTLHFAHLAKQDRSLLRIADDLEGHVRDLAEILSGEGSDRESASAFVREFIRPRGLDLPAAPILADEIEAAAELSVTPRSPGRGAAVLRALLSPIARMGGLKRDKRKKKKATGRPLWVRLLRPFVRMWVRYRVARLALAGPRRSRIAPAVRKRLRKSARRVIAKLRLGWLVRPLMRMVRKLRPRAVAAPADEVAARPPLSENGAEPNPQPVREREHAQAGSGRRNDS